MKNRKPITVGEQFQFLNEKSCFFTNGKIVLGACVRTRHARLSAFSSAIGWCECGVVKPAKGQAFVFGWETWPIDNTQDVFQMLSSHHSLLSLDFFDHPRAAQHVADRCPASRLCAGRVVRPAAGLLGRKAGYVFIEGRHVDEKSLLVVGKKGEDGGALQEHLKHLGESTVKIRSSISMAKAVAVY